jgi:hypothetical protein
MMAVSNEFPPSSEDGDEVNDFDNDGAYHHPRQHTKPSKS